MAKINAYSDPEKAAKIKAAIAESNKRRKGSKRTHQQNLATSEAIKKKWQDPNYRSKIAPVLHNNSTNTDIVEKIRQTNLNTWSDSELLMCHSEKMQSVWTHAAREQHSKIMTEVNADPNYRSLQSKLLTDIMNTPKRKEIQSNISKGLWTNKEYRTKVVTAQASIKADPEYRLKISEAHKLRCAKPEVRAKMAEQRKNMPRSDSNIELKTESILRELGIKFVKQYEVDFYSFDFYLPDHHILIEVQGDYWHNTDSVDESIKKNVRNDAAKSTKISKYFPQYKLYYIWEHEFDEINKVLEKIKYWVGMTRLNLVNFGFENVGVKPIKDNSLIDQFLYNWHYQHIGNHGLDICGYLGDEPICVARFTSPNRKQSADCEGYSQKEVLELSRLVVCPKYQKKNLLSWFLARCEKIIKLDRPEIKCLISFADSTYNHSGTVYKASNWIMSRIVEPSYFYVSVDNYVMTRRVLWQNASKMRLTENEYATKYNYLKVDTMEKYKFIKII